MPEIQLHKFTRFVLNRVRNFVVILCLNMFPTVFNTCNLLIMIWFTKLYVKVVCWIMPAKHKDMEEEFTLKYIGRGMLSASELNITQAQKR